SNLSCRNRCSPSVAVARAVTAKPYEPRYSLSMAAKGSSSSMIRTCSAMLPLVACCQAFSLTVSQIVWVDGSCISTVYHYSLPLQTTASILTDIPLFLTGLPGAPAASELQQLGTLLWREYVGNVRQGCDKPLRGRIHQLQFRVTNVL